MRLIIAEIVDQREITGLLMLPRCQTKSGQEHFPKAYTPVISKLKNIHWFGGNSTIFIEAYLHRKPCSTSPWRHRLHTRLLFRIEGTFFIGFIDNKRFAQYLIHLLFWHTYFDAIELWTRKIICIISIIFSKKVWILRKSFLG